MIDFEKILKETVIPDNENLSIQISSNDVSGNIFLLRNMVVG